MSQVQNKSTIRLMMLTAGLAVTVAACAASMKPLDNATGTPSSKPLPTTLFQHWPQKKPDVAIILSGEQHSYLKFCGCSHPQKGGFERRFNFLAKLREKGWPIAAVDVGDLIYKKAGSIQAQTYLKYVTSMKALSLLGYSAVGIGEQEFNLPLWEGLSRYTLQNPDAKPFVLSANLNETQRNNLFPAADGKGSMIKDSVIINSKDHPRIGVVAVVAPSVREKIHDKQLTFDNNKAVLTKALAQFEKENVAIRILLYQGFLSEAREVVKDFPSFQIVLCRSLNDLPPAQPTIVGKSMIVEIGHKGQHIGVVGAFKTGTDNPPFEFHYQLVELGEDYETDDDKVSDHKVIQALEEYSERVKQDKLMLLYPKTQHPMQVALPREKIAFVGSEACKACHEADYAKWKESKHSHAYDALVKYAKKPSLRQFDGDCVICHTIGYAYETGYVDETRTPKLKDVGCENCHGPGSAHVANPMNKALYKHLSPWKGGIANARVGEPDTYNEKVLLAANNVCQQCHDVDNDPKFRFEQYWPKIEHGKKPVSTTSTTNKSK